MTASPLHDAPEGPALWKRWLIAIRPFALPASSMPILLGTATAVVINRTHFSPGLFLMALLGMMMLHSAANIINDIEDYKKGLDTVATPVSGAVVRGLLSLRTSFLGALLLLCGGSALGLVLAYLRGPAILYLGLVGVIIGVSYTAGPLVLKYRGLGDLAVFLDFGILGSLGAWMVQTGTFSWTPLIWAIPLSMLVVAILHANNWRDSVTDTGKGIRTVASSLGDRGSMYYYGFLIFGAPLGIVLLMALTRMIPWLEPMPLTFSLVILAFPAALGLWKKARLRHNPSSPLDFIALDGASARYNLIFGILCLGALFLHVLLGRPG
jgi:1,4-dihydroxy-2-naphthoate polyprenyltransferase